MCLCAQLRKLWRPQAWHRPLNDWRHFILSSMRCRVLLFALVLVIQQLLDSNLLALPN